jgi:hypothetical protein
MSPQPRNGKWLTIIAIGLILPISLACAKLAASSAFSKEEGAALRAEVTAFRQQTLRELDQIRSDVRALRRPKVAYHGDK